MILNYNRNCSFIVLATVIMIVNYDCNTFIVQATGIKSDRWCLCQIIEIVHHKFRNHWQPTHYQVNYVGSKCHLRWVCWTCFWLKQWDQIYCNDCYKFSDQMHLLDVIFILIIFLYVIKLKKKPEAGSLNKRSCLAPSLGVTKFIIVADIILVTLCCST
jgi:hypothetical protein